jgi:propionyl-CoA carboxylase alpha chain
MKHDAFRSGKFDTHFVKHHFKPEYLSSLHGNSELIASLTAAIAYERLGKKINKTSVDAVNKVSNSKWKLNRA